MDHGLRGAAFDGQTEEVSWLLAEGGDVTAQDINGDTPLMIASQEGHEDVTQLLLEAGASLDQPYKDGHTALRRFLEGFQHHWM